MLLYKALYIPTIDINLFSGIRYYKANGYLDRETLKGPNGASIAVLDFQNSGFFLQIEGHQRPRLHLTSYINIAGTGYCLAQTTDKLVVELPSKASTWKDSFTRYDDDESSIVGPNSTTISPGSGPLEVKPRRLQGPKLLEG